MSLTADSNGMQQPEEESDAPEHEHRLPDEPPLLSELAVNGQIHQLIDSDAAEPATTMDAEHAQHPTPKELQRLLTEKGYEDALDYLERHRADDGSDRATVAHSLKIILADLKTHIHDAYPSLRYQHFVDKKYMGPDGNVSPALYVLDRVRALHLSEEDWDAIAEPLFLDLLNKLEQEIIAEEQARRWRGYGAGCVKSSFMQLLFLQYHLPIRSPQRLAKIHNRIRAIAPMLVMNGDDYTLQELGVSFNFHYYEEVQKNAGPKAMEELSCSDSGSGIDVERFLRIQEWYKIPVTKETREAAERVLASCIGYSNGEPEKLVQLFGITHERVHAIAVENVEEQVQSSKNYRIRARQARPNEKVEYDCFIDRYLTDYALGVDEIPALSGKVAALLDVARNLSDSTEDRKTVVQLFYEKIADEGLDSFIPNIFKGAVLRVLCEPDDDEYSAAALQPLKKFAETEPNPEWLYGNTLEKIFQVPTSKEMTEIRTLLTGIGLKPDETMKSWDKSCNNSATLPEDRPLKYRDKIGTHIVYSKNAAMIRKMETLKPGLIRYFHDTWGITMFCRYSPETLLAVYKAETEGKTTGKKKPFLMLHPEMDWNGGMLDPEKIDAFVREALSMGYNVHLGEFGNKKDAVRRFARCARMDGPIQDAIIAVHGNEKGMQPGENDEDRFSVEDLRMDSDDPKEHDRRRKLLHTIRGFFADRAHLYFKSCSVGKEGAIAEQIMTVGNIGTTGPDRPASMTSVNLFKHEAEYAPGAEGIPKSNTYRPPEPPPKRMRRVMNYLWSFVVGSGA